MASTGTCSTPLSGIYLGIDVGTSGIRIIAIDETHAVIAQSSVSLPPSRRVEGHVVQHPQDWWLTCQQALNTLLASVQRPQIKAISIDGTSGSVLLCQSDGTPLSDAYMYNDANNSSQAKQIKTIAPLYSGAHGASSGLAKCLNLLDRHKPQKGVKCLTQADWIAGNFTQQYCFSDQNNSLKLGYDPINQQWPEWLRELRCRDSLVDHVYIPGTVYSNISSRLAKDFDLPSDTQIVAGTTDSIAAFIATGYDTLGDAVTSLGSTLSLKVITDKPIFAPEFGIYSHRLGKHWLAGGASNSGGAVIKKYFNSAKITELTQALNTRQPTGLDYYPLLNDGERFPINNPQLAPNLSPRADNDLVFFQGILEGISNIEKTGYKKLAELGANYPTRINTMGGGSINMGWQQIRQRILGVPVSKALITEAAFGAALLAKQGYQP